LILTTSTTTSTPHIRRLLAGEAGFPVALAAIPSPAKVLWYRGVLPDPEQPGLAVVGSRAATVAGCRRARDLAAAAAGHGYAIVSGGALGIDAAAHRGALDARGATFAVFGCGVDVIYPDRHERLYDEIRRTGGLISEYPPGTPPRGRQFPARNRLVAGLAGAVLVVEANQASGALVTARLGLRMGRPVFAVSGSPGTDGLIAARQARPVADEASLLDALAGRRPAPRAAPPALALLLESLAAAEAGPAELARRLGRSLPDTLALLAEAELDGWVRRGPAGRFSSLQEIEEVSRGS
jgi:DNA processing protein